MCSVTARGRSAGDNSGDVAGRLDTLIGDDDGLGTTEARRAPRQGRASAFAPTSVRGTRPIS